MEGLENIDKVFYYQSLPNILKVIRSKLANRHHNDPLASYFGIKKTWKLVARKYYWPTSQKVIETYVKGYNVYLILKIVQHKLYNNFQLLLIQTY